jgi:hypothetical protein
MNRKLLIILLVSLLLPAFKVAAQNQTLVLHHADGKTTEVELYTMPRIQMTADKMIITVQGYLQEFDKADVVRFTFKGIGTGIHGAKPEMNYRIDKDHVTFYGIGPTDRITVCNTSGVQLPAHLSTDGRDAVLSLTQLPQGVYLVTINGRTLKFIRP